MGESYTKLLSSLPDSTIWSEDHATRIVWITMLAMADQNGYVGASVPGLAARAKVTVQEVETALSKFLAPDPYSRSKEHEGRRIAEATRGWILLNYRRIRDMRADDARREYERTRKAAQRRANLAKSHEDKMSRTVPDNLGQSHDVPLGPGLSAQAEAEAEAEEECGSRRTPLPVPSGVPDTATRPDLAYTRAFQKRYAQTPAIHRPTMRAIHEEWPDDDASLCAALEHYVASDDAWLLEHRHPLGVFRKQANQYAKPNGSPAALESARKKLRDAGVL